MQVDRNIFKAYDIRGVYGDSLTDKVILAIGNIFAQLTKSEKIIVGRDMRLSSDAVFTDLCQGINQAGVDVIDIGLVSTDATYFAAGFLNCPALMVTASHNPSEWNGFKLTLAGAIPFGQEEIQELRDWIEQDKFITKQPAGKIISKNILPEYINNCRRFIDQKNISAVKIAVDAGNAMAGKIVPLAYKKLPCQIMPLYFELDGSFPNHQPSPIESKNLVDLQKIVREKQADFGMAFDGDADRVFFIDETGRIINGGIIVALLAEYFLTKHPGEKIIYDLRCSHVVPEIIKARGGEALISRVGHSFIKKTMKETGAVFGGEFSGHFYYRDNYRADSAIVTALIITEIISQARIPLSNIVKKHLKYFQIEETNSNVSDKDEKIKILKARYADGKQTDLDGLTVEYPNWWFNVRPSNTEPLLRLNLEADAEELMREKTEEILKLIRQ